MTTSSPTSSALADARQGALDILPPMLAAVPISLVYGAICAAKGMSPLETTLASALVFAGGAQFAATELWALPPPYAALFVSTLLINARHVLMGASIRPKTHFGAATPLAAFFMADENWAMAERRVAQGRPISLAYWLGSIIPFYFNWVSLSGVGAAAGSLLGDPKALGADFAFTALFIGLVAGFWKGRSTAVTIVAAAGAAALAYRWVGSPWHVLAGASAGMTAAALTARGDVSSERETAR
jgi:predicted branched-subunit amino acid permease